MIIVQFLSDYLMLLPVEFHFYQNFLQHTQNWDNITKYFEIYVEFFPFC